MSKTQAQSSGEQQNGHAVLGYRLLQLGLLSLLNFGLQVSYDSVGASAPLLRKDWDLDAEAIGDLIAAYHLPNIVMAAFGGMLVD